MGIDFTPTPANVEQLIDVVEMATSFGKKILIMPVLDKGLLVVMLKVYEVIAATLLLVTLTAAERELLIAVTEAEPVIIGKPFLKTETVIGSVGRVEGGALKLKKVIIY